VVEAVIFGEFYGRRKRLNIRFLTTGFWQAFDSRSGLDRGKIASRLQAICLSFHLAL
jgi:hypothetical protein